MQQLLNQMRQKGYLIPDNEYAIDLLQNFQRSRPENFWSMDTEFFVQGARNHLGELYAFNPRKATNIDASLGKSCQRFR